MTAASLIETALLLGLFVLAGGAYAGLYSIGRLRARPGWVRIGRLCYAAAFLCAVAVGTMTPLDIEWKLLILASAIAYAVIPPLTWRYLERLHTHEELEP
ncbi:hypothetical protein [Castellaniella sp. MT123]|uniref:hypothetical protein n=1 Tax=Castellaniella sp. MT123 TaxID=3140381 RepID=UPI0031F3C308